MSLHIVTLPAIIHTLPSSTPRPSHTPFHPRTARPLSSLSLKPAVPALLAQGRHHSVSAIRSQGCDLGDLGAVQAPSSSLSLHPYPPPQSAQGGPRPWWGGGR